jgi:hypothetical protein
MIEEVFKRGAEEVDHEDIVEAFLTEVIDIRNTSYLMSVYGSQNIALDVTHGSQREFCRFDIRLAVVEHRSFEAPVQRRYISS